MTSKNFSDWADVRQLVMEKLTNRIQVLLKEREDILSPGLFRMPNEQRKEFKQASEERQAEMVREAKNQRLQEIRQEINRLANKLVESTEGNMQFDLAAGKLTEFCSK